MDTGRVGIILRPCQKHASTHILMQTPLEVQYINIQLPQKVFGHLSHKISNCKQLMLELFLFLQKHDKVKVIFSAFLSMT